MSGDGEVDERSGSYREGVVEGVRGVGFGKGNVTYKRCDC